MLSGEIITSFDDAFRPTSDLTVPLMRRYAAAHGLKFAVEPSDSRGRAPHWGKIVALKRTLARGADFVMWVDADATFVRADVDIRDHVDGSKDVFLTKYRIRGIPDHVNTGVMVIRNTAWARDFLDRVWANQMVPEHEHGYDQSALNDLLGFRRCIARGDDCETADLAHVGWLDPAWNVAPALNEISTPPIIRHHCGLPGPIRRSMIRMEAKLLAMPPGLRAVASRTLDWDIVAIRKVLLARLRYDRKANAARTPLIRSYYRARKRASSAVLGLLAPGSVAA